MFWMFLNSPHLRGSWWKTKDIWSLTVSLYLSFPFCSSRSSRKPGVSVPLFPDWLGLRLCHFLLLPHLMVYLPFMIKRNQEEKLASPLRNKTRRQLKVFAIFVPAYEAGAPRIGNILGHIINFHLSGTNDQKSFFFFLRVLFDGRRGKETLKSKVSLTKKNASVRGYGDKLGPLPVEDTERAWRTGKSPVFSFRFRHSVGPALLIYLFVTMPHSAVWS